VLEPRERVPVGAPEAELPEQEQVRLEPERERLELPEQVPVG